MSIELRLSFQLWMWHLCETLLSSFVCCVIMPLTVLCCNCNHDARSSTVRECSLIDTLSAASASIHLSRHLGKLCWLPSRRPALAAAAAASPLLLLLLLSLESHLSINLSLSLSHSPRLSTILHPPQQHCRKDMKEIPNYTLQLFTVTKEFECSPNRYGRYTVLT